MEIGFKTILNPRDDTVFEESDLQCHVCGCQSTVMLVINIPLGRDKSKPLIICKGCLDKGIQMINQEILK